MYAFVISFTVALRNTFVFILGLIHAKSGKSLANCDSERLINPFRLDTDRNYADSSMHALGRCWMGLYGDPIQ